MTPDWTDESLARAVVENRGVRVEFEHVVVWADTTREALRWARRKGWGKLTGIGVPADDEPWGGPRLALMHKPSSPYRRRFERRRALAASLGGRRYVSAAMRLTLGRFTEWVDDRPEDARAALQAASLGTPRDFWRAVRGLDLNRSGCAAAVATREGRS